MAKDKLQKQLEYIQSQMDEYMDSEEEYREIELPWWQKPLFSPEEASEYFGIGVNKIRKMARLPECSFVLNIGSGKMLIKKKRFEQFLMERSMI